MVDQFLDAMGGISPEYVEQCAVALGYLPRKKSKFPIRGLLIAAILTALLAASALAAGLLGRQNRLAEMPPDPAGEKREALIPNSFRGTPTYLGTQEWWAYLAKWKDEHGEAPLDFDLSFTSGNYRNYQICLQYRIYEEELLNKLLEIADRYELNLYRESLMFSDREGFYALSGTEPFLEGDREDRFTGNIYPDGSFWLEGILRQEGEDIIYTVRRMHSNSIYPFGGATEHTDYEEAEYRNARGQQVILNRFATTGELGYVSTAGDTFLSFELYFPEEISKLNRFDVLKEIADRVDFEALLKETTGDQETPDPGAEHHGNAVEKVKAFQGSSVFQAGKEFHSFFTEHFYGAPYREAYGLPGYEDVDAEMERLSQKYQLKIPKAKSLGNNFSEESVVFDNGSFCYRSPQGPYGVELTLHYMPKDALYTGMYLFTDIEGYRRVWEYETESGVDLILYAEGPERTGSSFALYEDEHIYILLDFGGGNPQTMLSHIEQIPWDLLLHKEEEK